MKVVILTLLIAVVSPKASAGLGGVMRSSSGKIHQVIVHGALIALLCNGLACAPPKIVSEAPVANQMVTPESMVTEPEMIEGMGDIIEKTELNGNADIPFGAIDYHSVGRYLEVKETLTADFYNNMLVHHLDDEGNNFVGLLSLVDGNLLARHGRLAQGIEIKVEQIAGVLVGKDPLIGAVASVLSTNILAFNGIEIPPSQMELQLVGTINQVFTSNHYQLHVRGFIINGKLIDRPLGQTGLVFVHSDDLWLMPTGDDTTAQQKAPLDILARLP